MSAIPKQPNRTGGGRGGHVDRQPLAWRRSFAKSRTMFTNKVATSAGSVASLGERPGRSMARKERMR